MTIEPTLYDQIKKHTPLPCIDLPATHKNKLPPTLRNNPPAKDQRFTPGGRIHKDETLEEAVKRVLHQETATTNHHHPSLNHEPHMVSFY